MDQLFFWNSWNKTDKSLYLTYLFIFFSTFIMLACAYVYGREGVIQWDYQQETKAVKTTIAKTQHNLHDYNIEADNYIVSEQYATKALNLNPVYMYVYLGLIMLAMVLLLTVITYLDLWYYLGAMTIFLLYLGYMQTELLGVFGLTNKQFLVGTILAFIIPSYLLRSYSHTSILRRLLIFIAITIVFLLCIFAGAQHVKQPLLFLPNLGIVLPICMTVVFLVIIGFDLIKAFLYMVSTGRAEQKKNSLTNFLIISGLYILSVLLSFLKKKLYIDWDIIYVNGYIFYAFSAIYGIWAFKKRNILFKDVLPFRPLGAFLYLGLGIISTATMAYAFIMANDPLAEALEYAIIYTQLCLSIIFVFYILFNFYNFFPTNLNIYDVVYKPNSMPFFMVRGIGVVAVIALYFYSNQFPLRLAQAGYYNAAGDVYYLEKDSVLAKQYYYEGYGHEPQNVRSSYALALLYEKEGDLVMPKVYYENSLIKHKNVESFIGLSNVYYNNEQYFLSLFTLKDGLKFFPASPELYNNIGFVYERMNIGDSAQFFFAKAHSLGTEKRPVALNNLIFNCLKHNNTEAALPLIKEADPFSTELSIQTNLTVLKSINGQKTSKEVWNQAILNKKIEDQEFYLINNYVLNHLGEKDTTISKFLMRIQENDTLVSIRDNVRWLRALAMYYSGEKLPAMEIMMNLHLSGSSASYTNTLGIWMLNEQAYPTASDLLYHVMRYGDQTSAMNFALSGTLWNMDKMEYLPVLDSLRNSKSPVLQKEAEDHFIAMTSPSYNHLKLASVDANTSDLRNYLYYHYHFNELSEAELGNIRTELRNPDYITLSAAELMQFYIRNNRAEEARQLYKTLEKYEVSHYAMGPASLAYLEMLVALKDWNSLKEEVTDIYLLPQDAGMRDYYLAIALQNTNDTKGALTHYRLAVKRCPLNPTVCIGATEYFNKEGDPQEAYDLLQEAITYNKNNGPLLVAYCRQAIQLNLPMYAEYVLPDMTGIVDPSVINEIKQLIKKASTIE